MTFIAKLIFLVLSLAAVLMNTAAFAQSKHSTISTTNNPCEAWFEQNPKLGSFDPIRLTGKQKHPGDKSLGCYADLIEVAKKVRLETCSLIGQSTTIDININKNGAFLLTSNCNLMITPINGNPRVEWDDGSTCRFSCLK